jgi:hypothetical protein
MDGRQERIFSFRSLRFRLLNRFGEEAGQVDEGTRRIEEMDEEI